jgi:hypothetical protein
VNVDLAVALATVALAGVLAVLALVTFAYALMPPTLPPAPAPGVGPTVTPTGDPAR